MLETLQVRTRQPRSGLDATAGQAHGDTLGHNRNGMDARLALERYTGGDVDPLKVGSVEVNTAGSE